MDKYPISVLRQEAYNVNVKHLIVAVSQEVIKDQQEYLLVKNFNIVFEAIIDELIGDRIIPKGLKEQEDGKRVDHMYAYKGLTTHEEDKPIYYIGDSKYYKIGNQVGKESVYKQFTYARNVIQWNLKLFMDNDANDEDWLDDKRNFGNVPLLRDETTEGYNVIPNFFVSARLNKELDYKDEIEQTSKKHTHFCNKHFENRLFDRDTLLISHYDVNFLYVVSLYARNNTLQKDAWKEKVRGIFRQEIQKILAEKYDFYAMTAHPDVDAETYIKKHFQDILGKIYSPYADKKIFSLALDNDESFKENNEKLLTELRKHFYVEGIDIGKNPTEKLEHAKAEYDQIMDGLYGEAKNLIQDDVYVLIGYYKTEEHLNWILDSGLYNTRTGTQNGSLLLSKELLNTQYLLLHHDGKFSRFIKLKDAPRIMMGKDLAKKGYPYDSEEEKVDKSSMAYVVFKLDETNTEKVFESYSWDMKNLNLKIGNQSAVPQYMSLAELVKRRNR